MNFFLSPRLSIGPLVISTPLLYILIGIGTGSILFTLLTRKDKSSRKIAANSITNFLLIVILIWKFLPIILSPGDIISNPLTILYASGGTIGLGLGSILGTAYLVYKFILLGKNIGTDTNVGAGRDLPLLRGVIRPIVVFFVVAGFVSSLLFIVSGIVKNGHDAGKGGERPFARNVGDMAPDFELKDIYRNIVSLHDYLGKWVILNFWATWCPPCRAELPVLIRFYENMDKDKVVLLGVNASNTEKSTSSKCSSPACYIASFAREKGINYPVLLDTCDNTLPCVSSLYGAGSLPTTIVISPDGIIAKIKTGAVDSFWLRMAVRGD